MSSSPSLKPGRLSNLPKSPYRNQPEPLDPSTRVALGAVKPALAWLQVQTLVQQAVLRYWPQAVQVAYQEDLPVDFTDLAALLEQISPELGLNQLHYIRPHLNLRKLMSQPPVSVLRAVVQMLVKSDRWQSREQIPRIPRPGEKLSA